MSLKIISFSSTLFCKSELSENKEFSTDTDTKQDDALWWKTPLGKIINKWWIAKTAGGAVLQHNTSQELQRKQEDLAKQTAEHYSRPPPKPGNTRHCTRKEDWMKAHMFTKVGSTIQAVKNLRDGSGDQQSLNIVGGNINLQLLNKTECFEPSCSLSVCLWLWELSR